MITTRVNVEDVSSRWVRYEFILRDESGSGIQKITLVDDMGMEIPVDQPQGCPIFFGFVTGPINRGRLPLWIETIDCDQGTTPREETGPIGSGEQEGQGAIPCSATDCADDPDCNRAVADVVRAQNAVQPICRSCNDLARQIHDKELERVAWAVLAVILLIAAVVLAAFFQYYLSAVLIAVAISVFVQIARLGQEIDRLIGQWRECNTELEAAEARLNEVIDIALATCCPGCINIPLTNPC